MVYADAEHDAYAPTVHRRRVAFIDSRYWYVIDDVVGTGTHRLDLRFQFAPMDVRIDGELVRASRTNERGLVLRTFGSTTFGVSVDDGRVSPAYGVVQAAPAVVCRTNAKLPARFVTLLWPAENVNEFPPAAVIAGAQGWL